MNNLTVLVGGGNSWYDYSNLVEKVVWTGRKGAAPRTATITFADSEGYKLDRVNANVAAGQRVQIFEAGKENGEQRFVNGPSMFRNEQIGQQCAGSIPAMLAVDIDFEGFVLPYHVDKTRRLWKSRTKWNIQVFESHILNTLRQFAELFSLKQSRRHDEPDARRIHGFELFARRMRADPVAFG